MPPKWFPVLEQSQQGRSEPAFTKTIVSSLTWFPQRETFILTHSLSIPDAAACINPYLRKRSILWEAHSTHSTVGSGLSHFSKTKRIGLAHRVDLNISFLRTELMLSSRFCDMTDGGQTAQEKKITLSGSLIFRVIKPFLRID